MSEARGRYLRAPQGISGPDDEQGQSNGKLDSSAWGWVGAMSLAVIVYLLQTQYYNPDSPQQRLQQLARENCRLVFANIALAMEMGREPNPDSRCENAGQNIIERSGSLITVRHPDPAQLGLSEIYVTNQSRQVIMRP